MDYRDNADIIVETKLDDGSGGYTTQESILKTIKCKVAPYTTKKIDSKGREVSYSLNKLFTKESIVDDLDKDFKILYKDKMYNKKTIADYGKCFMVVMERDS